MSPRNIFQIIYLSECSDEMFKHKEIELPKIIASAKEFNSANGITGILLHKDNFFIQMLEGHEEKVKSLYIKIMQDKRHKNVTTLMQRYSEDRLFSEWSMALKIIEPVDEKSLRLTYAWDGMILNFKNKITIQEPKLNNLFELAA